MTVKLIYMKRMISVFILLLLTACAEKQELATATPIADAFIANQSMFIVNQCGGIFNNACINLYWSALIYALADQYGTNVNSKEINANKFCEVHPYDCIDERQTELLFIQLR